ncbi:MAG: phosphatidate cytidylyltransferase, partial [Syntrophobacteraceae bacterium]
MPDSQIPSSRAVSSSHYQRWITGLLIGIPVMACLILGPRWSWCLLISTVAPIAVWELHGLIFREPLPHRWQALSFSTAMLLPFSTYFLGLAGLNLTLFCAFFSALFLMLARSPRNPEEIPRIAQLVFAWVYVPFLLSFVLLLGDAPRGRMWVVFVLLVIIAGDAGAYHTGVKLGRHKLFERVSPKKTIEGALGGLLASLIAGSTIWLFLFRDLPFAQLLTYSFFIAAVGQVGDLFESMIKRNFDKKDSSGLLPGHGGLLDRLDSLLFAFP